MILSKSSRYAVVTGASGGLGRCYALDLARRGVNLIVVALPDTGLESVVSAACALGVECIPIEVNMSDHMTLAALCERINAYDTFMLINNVGTGGTRSFTHCDSKYIDNIIQLNVTVGSLMTHELLPNIIRGGGGWILNVSSMAAFSPTGWKTVYPASKRFIVDFSRGLRQELRGTGVGVSVVLPGAMRTNKDVTRRIELQGLAGRLTEQSPEFVAHASINAMLRGRCVIVPGLKNKLSRIFLRLIPSWICLPIMSAVVSREITLSE